MYLYLIEKNFLILTIPVNQQPKTDWIPVKQDFKTISNKMVCNWFWATQVIFFCKMLKFPLPTVLFIISIFLHDRICFLFWTISS
jgi:hypothetical protein